jgi:hypothetical protein
MPRFSEILTLAETLAVERQEYEVADAIMAEEPLRYGIVRKLTRQQQETYDKVLNMAFAKLLTKEYAGPIKKVKP